MTRRNQDFLEVDRGPGNEVEGFMSKMTKGSLLDVANEIFYRATKNACFMLLETAQRAVHDKTKH